MIDSARAFFTRRAARAHDKAGRFDAALSGYAALRASRAARPSDVVKHAQLAEASGRLDEAGRLHQANISLFPLEANVHRQQGLFLLRTGKENEALLSFARGAALAPGNAALKSDLERLGVSDEWLPLVATAAFHASGSVKPRGPGRLARYRAKRAAGVAKTLRQSGNWSGALGAQTTVVTNNPNNAAAQIRMGHVLKETGRFRDAVLAYWRGVALAPREADGYVQLGHALKLDRDNYAAMPAYLMASRLVPNHAGMASLVREFELSDARSNMIGSALIEADGETIRSLAQSVEGGLKGLVEGDEESLFSGLGSTGGAGGRRSRITKRPNPKLMDVRAAAIAGDIAHAVGVSL